MSAQESKSDRLINLLSPFIRRSVSIACHEDEKGQKTIRLVDADEEIGVEIMAEIGSNIHGHFSEVNVVEIDAFEVPKLTDKQKSVPLERPRIGYRFWNRAGEMEGPLVLCRSKVGDFELSGDRTHSWHADGRYAWAGDKKHQHPRDLVERIVPPHERDEED